MALLAVDLALELRRSAKRLEESGDVASAQASLADSSEQLEKARLLMPRGSPLAELLDKIVCAARSPSNDPGVNEKFEAEVDGLLDQLVAELEEVMAQARRSDLALQKQVKLPTACEFGCGYIAKNGFSTCCRACGISRGKCGHDDQCTSIASGASTAVVPSSQALVPTSVAI
jgi:hypothetical protein